MRKQPLVLLISLAITTLVFGQSARKGKDYAYLFYVTSFEDKNWPPLPETQKEVFKLKEELEANYGFEVEVIPNATKNEILSKIEEINQKKYKGDDQVFFFFSTHGYYDQATDRGYLIPTNGNINDPYGRTWISYDELGTYITVNPSEHVLLALDACYSGAFGDRFKNRPGAPPWQQYGDCQDQISKALAYNSRLYFTSGSSVQRTPAKSLFANRWLTALRKGHETGVVRSNDLRYHLGTIDYPQPENGSFSGKHQENGDFIFVYKNACNTEYADLIHWKSIGDPPDPNLVIEHLKKFPGCTHYQQALALATSGVTINENTTSTPANIPDNMVFIKGGSFQMGSKDGNGDEKPVHQVTVSDYYLSRVEVTVQEFSQFVENTNYKTDAEKDGGSYFWEGGEWKKKAGIDWRYDAKGDLRPTSEYDHPVIHVSWNDAVAYCNWLSETQSLNPVYTITGDNVTANWNANGYRLPTEAEWEFAARSRGGNNKWAGTSSESQLSKFGNFCDKNCTNSWKTEGQNDGYKNTAPVGSYESNSLGLHDMSGNVWEWCWDWNTEYPSAAQTDPKGPASGSYRVIRGGSWYNLPAFLRCANRYVNTPVFRNNNIGFRLSRAVR